MANKETKKRIYARERVNVDDRTSGIRGHANTTNALGDMASRQSVSRGTENDSVLWEALSNTFRGVSAYVRLNTEKADREAEKERDRQQRLMDQRMTIEGDRLGIEIDRKVRDGINSGQYKTFDDIRTFIDSETDGLRPEVETPLFNAMQARVQQTLEFSNTHFLERDKREMEADNITATSNLLSSMYNNLSEDTDPRETEKHLADARAAVLALGKTDVDFNTLHFNTALSEMMVAAQNGDSEKSLLIRDKMLFDVAMKVPLNGEGKTGTQRVYEAHMAAIETNKARERREQAYAEDAAKKEQTAAYGALVGDISQATSLEQLDAVWQPHSEKNGRELFDAYGLAGVDISKLVDAQRELITTGRKPPGNAEAVRELEERLNLWDSDLLYGDDFMTNYVNTGKLIPAQVTQYSQRIAALRDKPDADLEQVLLQSLEKFQKSIDAGKTAYSKFELFEMDDRGRRVPNREGLYVLSALRTSAQKVNPADYKNRSGELLIERFKAAETALVEISNGNTPGLEMHKRSKELRSGEAAVLKSPAYFTMQDIQEEPGSWDILKKSVMPEGASQVTIKRNIEQVKSPEVQEMLKVQNRVEIMAAKTMEARIAWDLEGRAKQVRQTEPGLGANKYLQQGYEDQWEQEKRMMQGENPWKTMEQEGGKQ